MSVRKVIIEKEGVYFITFTCTDWIPLFSICKGWDIVYNGFNVLKENKHNIIGYITMPHLVHALIAFSDTGKSINSIVFNGKRIMAYALVERLKHQKQLLILQQLPQRLNNSEKKEGKMHHVFETSFDWKECRTEKYIEQKLDYMHWNPCKGNKLVELPEQYVHSSAKFYKTGGNISGYKFYGIGRY